MNKYYITTSIPYTNSDPHIGFALEIIQADVFSRHKRIMGNDVFFLTGTDEHGQKTFKVAKELGKTPLELADENSQKFRKLKDLLNLSNDYFIRTTDTERHLPSLEKIWEKMKEEGDIYKKEYKGLYCVGCEAFIPEKDLREGKCSIHLKEPEIVEEENYFFKLSKYILRIKELIESERIKIIPQSKKNEVLGMIKEGIEDVSFSRVRDKYWGFPIPGDNNQNFYVWPDALTNYISAINYYKEGEEFKKYWPADVHFIGKDIIKFHAIYWIGMLLSAKLETPKTIFVHGFITSNGQKMSKSIGNVVNPFQLVERYGCDPVRYYLLREIPPTGDGDFSFQKFENRYNSDLASGIGNLLSRTRKMAEKIGFNIAPPIEDRKEECIEALEGFKFDLALKIIWEVIKSSDRHIENNKPWEGGDNSKYVLGEILSTLDSISDMLLPFLPETAEKIKYNIERDSRFKNESNLPLFPRIDDRC